MIIFSTGFWINIYVIYCIVVLLYMAYKLWKQDYVKQALNIIIWMLSVTLIEIIFLAYMEYI